MSDLKMPVVGLPELHHAIMEVLAPVKRQLDAADKLCEVTTRACEQLVLGCERKKVHDAIDAYKQARETQP